MHKLRHPATFVFLIAIFVVTLLAHAHHVTCLPVLTLGSYNIRSGSSFSNVYNITQTGVTIRDLGTKFLPSSDPHRYRLSFFMYFFTGVDLIGLQEVDQVTQRHPDDQPAILSRVSGMQYVAYGKMRNYQGGGYGVAILSKLPILQTITWHYAPPGGHPTTVFFLFLFLYRSQSSSIHSAQPEECALEKTNDYCQGVLAVRVRPPSSSTDIWFATTHLGLGGGQFNETLQLNLHLQVLDPSLPVVITGDFNSVPTSDAIQLLTNKYGYNDGWATCAQDPNAGNTFDSNKPFERIDFQFLRKTNTPSPLQCIPKSAVVPNTQTSDHRPLVVQYQWQQQSS